MRGTGTAAQTGRPVSGTVAAGDSRRLAPRVIVGTLVLAAAGGPWSSAIFAQRGWEALQAFLVALSAAYVLTPLMGAAGRRLGIVDLPNARRIHQRPTPRTGGPAVFLACLAALGLVGGAGNPELGGLLLAGFLLLAIGIVDDARDLPAWLKLGAQVLAALLVISTGTMLTLFPPGAGGDAANAAITLLWIVGITNAFNFFDGMDGLAAGLAVLLALFMGSVAFQTDQAPLGLLAVAIIGASLGFLPYNFRWRQPALVFLGDGGSTCLGFLLACLAVQGEWADKNPVVSFSNPLLIFGVLIYDMIHITVERLATGKVRSLKEWLSYVGDDHLHHRLARTLGSRQASVAMIFALTISLGLAAIVLRQADTTDAVLLLTQASLIVIMVTILEHAGRR